jgi:hypothetical protein
MTNKNQRAAWERFRAEIPWLQKAHRCRTAIACVMHAYLVSGGEFDVRKANLLRQCLGQSRCRMMKMCLLTPLRNTLREYCAIARHGYRWASDYPCCLDRESPLTVFDPTAIVPACIC